MTDEELIECALSSANAAEAIAKTGLTSNAYRHRAAKLGVYNPTMANSGRKVLLQEILEGKHPHYQTFKLRNRLIAEGIKSNECEVCHIKEWMGKPLQCQLDHVDGNRFNHLLVNLRMICPNCHAQTETFSGKIKKNIASASKLES